MDALDLRGGAEAAWELVSTANLYIQQVAPWSLAKEGRNAELDASLAALARALLRLAAICEPISSREGSGSCGRRSAQRGDVSAASWESIDVPPVASAKVTKPEILFPKPATV